jgi:hypothetical protein
MLNAYKTAETLFIFLYPEIKEVKLHVGRSSYIRIIKNIELKKTYKFFSLPLRLYKQPIVYHLFIICT